jgi:hypothetical protein
MSSPWRQFDEWEESKLCTSEEELLHDLRTSKDRIWFGQDISSDPRSIGTESEESEREGSFEIAPEIFHSGNIDTEIASQDAVMIVEGVSTEVDEAKVFLCSRNI